MTERAATTSTGGSDEADLSSREATLWDWVERWAAHRPDSAAILTETVRSPTARSTNARNLSRRSFASSVWAGEMSSRRSCRTASSSF